jgi:hypothetical protein
MGINPAHFNGAAASAVMPYTDCCTDIWFQENWQFHSRVGREELARAIAASERDIAEVLGYWPAPTWIAEEVHQVPRPHRPDFVQYGNMDVRGYPQGIRTSFGRVIAGGQRDVDLVGTVTTAGLNLVYSDADGDGVVDTVTVTIATSETDERLVNVYFAGHDGDQEWEIRPARTKAIAAGTFTATFWPWQFIDPDLWEALATADEPTAIDYDEQTVPPTYDNLVASADVYVEWNDTTEIGATFYWEPSTVLDWASVSCSCGGTGTCPACALTTQNGCLHVRDAMDGMVAAAPATYNVADATWEAGCFSVCRNPDFIKLWYYSGDIDQSYLNSKSYDPLSNWWAQTIAWLATARLDRPFCNCDHVQDMVKHLQADMALVGGALGYNTTLEQLNCPWGTRRGAVLAWERVSKLARKRARVAVI